MSGTPDELPPTAVDRALRQQFLHGMSYAAATVNVVTTDGVEHYINPQDASRKSIPGANFEVKKDELRPDRP